MFKHSIRCSCMLLALAVAGVSMSPASSRAEDFSLANPEVGFELVDLVSETETGNRRAELESMLEKAAEYYRDAEFALAVDHYEAAREIAPDRPDILTFLQLASEKRNIQREMMRSLPSTPEKREDYFKAKYAQAREYYRQKNYRKAYENFYALWMMGGDFRDTLKMLDKARDRGDIEPTSVFSFEATAGTPAKTSAITTAANESAAGSPAIPQPEVGDEAPSEARPESTDEQDRTAEQIAGHLADARAEIEAGNLDQAEAILNRARELDADNAEVREALQDVQNRREAIERQRRKAAEIEKLMAAGRDFEQNENFNMAQAQYAAVLRLSPENAEAAQRLKAAKQAQAELAAQREAEEKARQEAELAAQREAEAKARQEAELAAQREAEEKAQREAEAQAEKERQEALAAQQREAEALKQQAAEEAARLEAEEKRTRERLAELEREMQHEVARRTARLNQQGRAALENGNLLLAEQSFKEALELNADNSEAQAGMKLVEEARVKQAQRYDKQLADAQTAEDEAKEIASAATEPSPTSEAPQATESAETPEDSAPETAPDAAAAEEEAPTAEPDATKDENLLSVFKWFSDDKAETDEKKSFEVAQARPAAPAAPTASQSKVRTAQTAEKSLQAQLDEMHQRALRNYQQGDIEQARSIWTEMLSIAPEEKRALTYLENTQAEYERFLEDRKRQAAAKERQEMRQEILNSPVTIQTERPTPLSEFMRLISFSTVREIEYYIAEGAEADIMANFVDKPLKEVLDTLLLPIGLTWSMDENNLITIRSELFPQTFPLTTDQLAKVRSLLDTGELQRVIWGQAAPPAKGVEITLDERQRVLLSVGSRLHNRKLAEFLASLETVETPDLETRIYKIREDDGPKIRALIEALIESESGTPFEFDRKVFVDGSDLIIRDTPENITKIEELLLDEDFIEDLREERLEIQNFNLIPRDIEVKDQEALEAFYGRIKEAVETLLYARTGREAAELEGRRLWFDPATLQLTIVDTPTNINRVSSFIASLPELRRERQSKVINLDHAVAEELAGDLEAILGITLPGAAGGQEDQVIRRLRRGDEFTFRDLRIRLIRVEEGDPDDRNDDEIELNLITGTQNNQVTLRELDTIFFEDYEITAEDVQPSGGGGGEDADDSNRGEGQARILFRFVQPIEAEEGAAAGAGGEAVEVEASPNTIFPFGPLNALIVRFEDPAFLQEVEELVAQLDMPRPQVQVETKFVQVNESRAREFSADFNLEGVANDRDFNQNFFNIDTRFAQNQDEFRSVFEPSIENVFSSNLIKGTSVFDAVIGDQPALNFQLRVLEAEGILNIVNGPKVTMLDGIEGEFRIDRLGPAGDPDDLDLDNVFNPFADETDDELVNDDGADFDNRITQVVLLVTPEITSEKSIILQIIAELIDFDNNIGQNLLPGIEDLDDEPEFTGFQSTTRGIGDLLQVVPDPEETGQPDPILIGPTFRAANISFGDMLRSRKLVNTTARTSDGGTIVLGGWTGERTQELTSGIPVLRNMPYFGKLLFSRNQRSVDRTTLLIFLTANLIE